MANITVLPNGCFRSDLTVSPKNWDKKDASTNVEWKIYYMFHEPRHKPFPVRIKGFSCYKLLKDRQQEVAAILKDEKEKLEKGYNPRVGKIVTVRSAGMEITEDSELADGIRWAMNRYEAKPETLRDMKSQMENLIAAIPFLPYSMPTLKDIKPYHVEDLLNKTRDINNEKKKDALGRPVTKKMTDNTWNRYKTHLGMLLAVLKKNRMIEYNPAHEVGNKSIQKKEREAISPEDIERIDKHLSENHPGMWAYFHIFCHSEASEVELANVKVKDVDLKKRKFKVIIRKGNGDSEELHYAINNNMLPIWRNHLKDANPEHYAFSQDFLPGNKFRIRQDPPPHVMRADYITKQWEKRVKVQLGINHTLHVLKKSVLLR